MSEDTTTLLNVENLNVSFDTRRGTLQAIKNLSFEVKPGEVLGIVGESGCGKSITSLAILGLLPENSHRSADKLVFKDKNLDKLSERELRKLRGNEMAMIFQDPMTSLNPSFSIEFQLIEALKLHHKSNNKSELRDKAINLLNEVGIPDPEKRLKNYPHQLSGGMVQRIMIAMALAGEPKLLIADEPTTALDVTIQAQILNVLKKLQKNHDMGIIFITHDIGVVASISDSIMVMYAGQAVEKGPTKEVIKNPTHPYTEGLLKSLPGTHDDSEHRSRLPSIQGMVPDLVARPKGCLLHPRCPYAKDQCLQEDPQMQSAGNGQYSRCFWPLGGTHE